MTSGELPTTTKRTSTLRRVPQLERIRFRLEAGGEGDVCAFELPPDAAPIIVEAPSGRAMAIAPGDPFLATPGYREPIWWAAGSVPRDGLVPGGDYWVIADCGIVGELVSQSPVEMQHFGRVRYLGVVSSNDGEILNIRQFAVTATRNADPNKPVFLLVGTAGNVGKTTAGIAILRALHLQGHKRVIVLKATGTSSVEEITRYEDFGAASAFDCVDFGLPTTYPSGRTGVAAVFGAALDFCLSLVADAVIVECGGDVFGANVPEFLSVLKERSRDPKIILAAGDALGAFGAKQVLAETGLSIDLITGPCTDTPVLRDRIGRLCGVPAINLLRNPDTDNRSGLAAVHGLP